MNRILKILKGKSLKGLGKLTKIAWIFNISKDEAVDADIISVKGVPVRYFMISGASSPSPAITETIKKIEVLQPLRGRIDIGIEE